MSSIQGNAGGGTRRLNLCSQLSDFGVDGDNPVLRDRAAAHQRVTALAGFEQANARGAQIGKGGVCVHG